MKSGRGQPHHYTWMSNEYKVSAHVIKNASFFVKLLPALKHFVNKVFIDNWKKNVTTYKELLFNNLSHVIIQKAFTPFSRVSTKCEQFFTKNGKKNMELSPLKIINPAKDIVSALKLSQAGYIRLMVYPEKALVAGLSQLKRQHDSRKALYWLFDFLDDFCKKNRLHIDWDLLPIMNKKYNIPIKADYFEKQIVEKSYVNMVKKEIVSPLVGKWKNAHPMFAHFIPEDLRLPEVVEDEVVCFDGGSGTTSETEVYSLQSV